MAKPGNKWALFPHAGEYTHTTTSLKKHWARLHAGDREPLPGRADVTVDIHDASGARVRRLFSGSLDGGERALAWDGRDAQGRAAASGVYFVRARVGSEQLTGRVVIVR